ncbi:hypothetical protein F4819DRAFT_262916 [Hypoxylon fuscum]|nr:hypothetical protein F4819DRAFT_262916 [Hypoxylon fuscum]
MGHSSESRTDPEQPFRLQEDMIAHSPSTLNYSPEPLFQPHALLPEFIDSPLGCERPADDTTQCTFNQNNLANSTYEADSDISKYLTLPIGIHPQGADGTTEYHNDATQRLRFKNRNHAYEEDKPQGENETSFVTYSRRSSRSSNKITSDESGVDKRARNRMAAYKCRKKQKIANQGLQERARIIDEQHNYLMAHKASLESEMIDLKNALLIHGGCGCQTISDYLVQAANKFVNGRDDNRGNMGGGEHRASEGRLLAMNDI